MRILFAKTIVIRSFRTPAAVKALTYFLLAFSGVQHPGPRLPRWLVTKMLSVAAGQHRNPVSFFVLPEIDDR